MKSTRLEPSCCPYCEVILDTVLDLQDHSPKPEDITICNECGEVSVSFLKELTEREYKIWNS